MRKASIKCELNYYQGRRIAFSDAINIVNEISFYVTPNDPIVKYTIERIKNCMIDEYKKNLSEEKKLFQSIYGDEKLHKEYIPSSTRPFEEEE